MQILIDEKLSDILTFNYTTFFSCDKAFEEQEVVYHIIKEQIVEFDSSVPPPPPLPATFYGQHNFIVSKEGNTFYHNKFKDRGWCGTGVDYTKPDFLGLRPKDLVELTDTNLEQFINKTVQSKAGTYRRIFASISSPTDTITNKQFQIIINAFREKGFRFYSIRKTTEEELAVLNAKIKNENYNSDSIKWKEEFGGIKFLPPKN